MDYQDIIKLEEESPVYSTGNNSHTMKQYMASFYDNDSQQERREPYEELHDPHCISFEQAIDYIQNYVNIIDTPLEDIIHCFDKLQCAQDLDKNLLRKKLLKRKNLLKRYRAKNRQPKVFPSYELFPELTTNNGLETEAEIKKKRNRVSAQISRDRKKQYFKELELKNQQLEEQIIRARLENEKLKKQMEDTESRPRNKISSQTFNNKLTKLLIFLGIICLIGMLKETFTSTAQSLVKFKTAQKLEQFGQFSSGDHSKMIEQGHRRVAEILQDPQIEYELMNTEQRKATLLCDITQSERNRPKGNIFQGLIQKLSEMKGSIENKME